MSGKMAKEYQEYFSHLVTSDGAQLLSFASLLAYANLSYLTWFPFLSCLPWCVLMYFHVGDETTMRDRLMFLFIYTVYHAIVMFPLSTTIGIPMPFAMLAVYLPVLVYYERKIFIPPFLRKINDYSGDFFAQQMLSGGPSSPIPSQNPSQTAVNEKQKETLLWKLLSAIRISDYPDGNSIWHNCYCMMLWNPPFLIASEVLSSEMWRKLGMRSGGLCRPLVSIINDELCLGPLPHCSEIIDLYKEPYNVRALVNCCSETLGPLTMIRKYGIHYCRAPTTDMCQPGLFEIVNTLRFVNCWLDTGLPPIPENQRQSVDPPLMNEDNDSDDDSDNDEVDSKDASSDLLTNDVRVPIPKSKRGRVFVHCMGGQGRSTSIMLCILIQRYRMDAKKAMDLIKSKRPFVSNRVLQYPIIQQFIQLMEKNDYRV